NRRQMEALTSLDPPADRVHQVASTADAHGAEITRTLLAALADGTQDPQELAKRLGRDAPAIDFSPIVASSDQRPAIQDLRILNLTGDFVAGSDPPTVKKANARVRIRARCRPKADALPGLGALRLELVQ